MSEASAAADQLTREGIQFTEMTAKLAGLGAKNLAALVMALMKDSEKLAGKTSLRRLLQDGKELKVVPLPKDKIAAFTREAKRYGVLFSIINDKESNEVDLLVRAEDAAKINRIFERIHYDELAESEAEKNADACARLGNGSRVRGQNLLPEPTHMPLIEERPSVREAIRLLKSPASQPEHEAPPVISLPVRLSPEEPERVGQPSRRALPHPKFKPKER